MQNLATATPAEIDSRLADLAMTRNSLDQQAKWERGTRKAITEARLAETDAQIDTIRAEYARRGGWNRAYKVTNGNGHIHRSMNCSTCRVTTSFFWLTEVSGWDEAQIVAEAGEAACSICYPTAPVAVRERACTLLTPDELAAAEWKAEQAAARPARQAAKKARQAASALLPDGSPLVIEVAGWEETFKTVQTARSFLTNVADYGDSREGGVALLAEAVAAKEGKTVEQVWAEAEARAAKRK